MPQSINQSINASINQPINQSTNLSINQSSNLSINQSINQSMTNVVQERILEIQMTWFSFSDGLFLAFYLQRIRKKTVPVASYGSQICVSTYVKVSTVHSRSLAKCQHLQHQKNSLKATDAKRLLIKPLKTAKKSL